MTVRTTPADRWLATTWPVVRERLPAPPAQVVELGCGPLGGFVPMLRSSGYEAIGVDPEAPEEDGYLRVEFENAEALGEVDAVVASTSLHHVADPALVLDSVASTLGPKGTVVVVEWASEDFDEPTAQWCFERLGPDEEPGWLHRRREGWRASEQSWSEYLRGWLEEERIHAAGTLLALLDERFDREHFARGPYVFADLAGTSPADEQAAIDAGQIRATRVDYAGRLA
jgi:SAM-dependent methyltransferase